MGNRNVGKIAEGAGGAEEDGRRPGRGEEVRRFMTDKPSLAHSLGRHELVRRTTTTRNCFKQISDVSSLA
eukprot:759825-Hanusia_phi.AAC.8